MQGFVEKSIGIAGMGLMGQAIATVLRGADYQVCGWDIEPDRCHGCFSSEELARKSRVLILCLPTTQVCRSVLRTMPLQYGDIVLDTSTGDPRQVEALADELASDGVDYLDASISGSSAQVLRREVLVIVGGDPNVFAAYRGLLALFAKEVMHVGPAGAGTRMKLVSNLVLGLNRAALAEGLSFANALGVDLNLALEVLQKSMAYSRIMDTKGSKMVHSEFTTEAKLAQHLKDVKLMLDLSSRQLPLSDAHRQLLERAVELGMGDMDNSAIFKAYT